MEFKNVTLSYPHNTFLENVTVAFSPGSFSFITGFSGSGKSSFLQAMIGRIIPREGQILDDRGANLCDFSHRELQSHRRRCGFVYQDYQLIDYKTVEKNVSFGMEVCGYDQKTIDTKVPQLLHRVGLSDKSHAYPQELSGGEQQRVAIARALIHDPDIVLADEPTGNLDPVHTQSIVDLFSELNEAGSTVIFATHDTSVIESTDYSVYEIQEKKLIKKA